VGSLYLLTLCLESTTRFLGLLGGLTLATLFLARLDAILVIGVVGALFLYWRLSGNWQKGFIVLLGSLGLALVYGLMHNVLFAWRYLFWIFLHTLTPFWAQVVALGALVFIAATVWALVQPRAFSSVLSYLAGRWRILVLIGLLALLCYLVFVAHAWRCVIYWLAQYWTWPGLLIAVVGLSLILARKPGYHTWPFLAVTLTYGLVFILSPSVNPVQPWAMRRMVPLVLPALALCTAYAILSLPKLRWRLERAMQAVVIGGLLFAFLQMDRPFLRHVEYQGAWDQLAQLASRFEPEALLLFDNGDPSQHITQPLAYLFHRQVFVLQRERPEATFLQGLLEAAGAQGKPMYLVLSSGTLDWHPQDMRFEPLGDFVLQVPLTERSTQRVPQRVTPLIYRLDLYRLMPNQSPLTGGVSPPGTTVEMGSGEYPYLRGGFYGWDTMLDGTTFRWTNGAGRVALPRPAVQDWHLHLRVASGRPPQVPPARLSVLVNGVLVGERRLAYGYTFETWDLAVPQDYVAATSEVEIELRSDTWMPQAIGYNEDPRELGVMVDWLQVP
jgi:hypothetical protein